MRGDDLRLNFICALLAILLLLVASVFLRVVCITLDPCDVLHRLRFRFD